MIDEWIYSPELPEPFSFVLATIESKQDKWVEIVGFDGKNFQLPGRGHTHNVIAWMKVPDPATKPNLKTI